MVFPAGVITVSAENTTEFLGGEGTEESPYLISTKDHLNNVRKYLDAHFKMVADIVFTEEDFAKDGDFYNGGQGWEPFGINEDSAFTGMFDGDGHSITGLICDRTDSGSMYVGLFSYNNGHIQNLSMIDAHVYASTTSPSAPVRVGGISGYNDGTISNCYNTGNIISNSFNNYACAGGISGYNNGTIINCYNTGMISSVSAFSYVGGGIAGDNRGTISSCYNTGNVTARVVSVGVGGIAGRNFDASTINNCYNIGKINAISSVDAINGNCEAGGIVGRSNSKSVISNCYNVGDIAASAKGTENARPFAGGISGSNYGTIINCYYWGKADHGVGSGIGVAVKLTYEQMKQSSALVGFNFDSVWKFVGEDSYPFPVLQDVPHIERISIDPYIGFLDGIGTKENPYLVSNKVHLNNIRNHQDAHFKMVADIEFTEADFTEGGEFYNDGQGWQPIGTDENSAFKGTFNGNGYAVIGLICHRKDSDDIYAGLFGYNKGYICNLVMTEANISVSSRSEWGSPYAGSVAGINKGTVYNCYNKVGEQVIYIRIDGAGAISFTVTVKSRVPDSISSGAYSISGGFISKIRAGTTVSQLLNGINEKAYGKVFKGNAEVSGNTLIGTGMEVRLLDGSTVKAKVTAVVTGDTNGDGNITITDMLAVKSHLLKKSTLSGAAAKAADTSGDKAISITDFIQIKAHILGKDKIQPKAC